MKVSELIGPIRGEIKAGPSLDKEITGCYMSDMLSDVLANSSAGNLLITHHTHANVVVVAAVKELSAVLVTDSKQVEAETIQKAEAEGVNVLVTGLSAFEAAGVVYGLLKGKC